jgi:para-aminobenzoate synthetase component 2
MSRVLVVDNRDSFVFNLVDDLARKGAVLTVVRGDAPLDALLAASRQADLVLISPGPGHPAHTMLPEFLRRVDAPTFGVCLGMQAMSLAFGGKVVRAVTPVHGRASMVRHSGDALFAGVPSPFPAARYHSLMVDQLPTELVVIARTDGGIPMGLRHASRPLFGVQFHPESVLTPHGSRILRNALQAARAT